jgi:hypothetical protein
VDGQVLLLEPGDDRAEAQVDAAQVRERSLALQGLVRGHDAAVGLAVELLDAPELPTGTTAARHAIAQDKDVLEAAWGLYLPATDEHVGWSTMVELLAELTALKERLDAAQWHATCRLAAGWTVSLADLEAIAGAVLTPS